MNPALFLVLAVLTIASALTVILQQNPVHSAVGLVATLCLLAVMFLGLDAQLLGFLQIIVYAGAIVVLFLFVIMLLNVQVVGRIMEGPLVVAAAVSGAVALVVFLLLAIAQRGPRAALPTVPSGFGETSAVGERLFTAYLLPFELTSLLLLVAVVGAVALAKRRPS
ncbi:MAG: NADH-quinone oxidoreductase subunit J [Candidatus Binatia bacterium]